MKLVPICSEIFSAEQQNLTLTLFYDSQRKSHETLAFVGLTPYQFVDQLLLNVVPPVFFQWPLVSILWWRVSWMAKRLFE